MIATSEAYESSASAINGIESVKRNAPNAEIDDQTDQDRVILLDACIGLAVPGRPIRSLVAEERSAGGVHDRTGRARRYTLGTRGAGTKRTASGTSGHYGS